MKTRGIIIGESIDRPLLKKIYKRRNITKVITKEEKAAKKLTKKLTKKLFILKILLTDFKFILKIKMFVIDMENQSKRAYN